MYFSGSHLVEIPTKMAAFVLYCHLLALVFFGLAFWLCRHETQPLWPLCGPRQFFTDPTRHALSPLPPSSPWSSSLLLPVLSLSLLHGVDSAFWMLATNILKVFVWFVTFYCRWSPRDKCKLIFHLKHWHSIFIGCESQLKVIVFNVSSPVMGVYLSFQVVWHLDAGKFSGC